MEGHLQSDIKVPNRRAPALPNNQVSNKLGSHTMDLLSLGNDPFNPLTIDNRTNSKKKPPPRPPPPKNKINSNIKSSSIVLDIFGRSKDISRSKTAATAIVKPLPPVQGSVTVIDSLIDLHSPSASPTFTKSSSSGVSMDSFNSFSLQPFSNSSSQIESGFEDDFTSSTATTPSNELFSDSLDPFSPTTKVPPHSAGNFVFELSNDDPKCKYQKCVTPTTITKPTIIRVKTKPSRPPPPSQNKLKCESQKVIPSIVSSKKNSAAVEESLDVENTLGGSPPMPNIPPPPPPPEVISALLVGPTIPPRPFSTGVQGTLEKKQPYCVAEYNYEATHSEDLSFAENDIIYLLNKVNDDWLRGSFQGKEGIFPANYVKIIVPMEEPDFNLNMTVISLYPFVAETWDDLAFEEGEEIRVLKRIDENWFYGEINGRRGQFPENFVQDVTQFYGGVSL